MACVGTCLRRSGEPPQGLLDDLISAYEEERLAAAALDHHAECAPYSRAAGALQRLANSEKRHAEMLADEITALGATPPRVMWNINPDVNHWHRLAACFQQADEKRSRFLERSLRWHASHSAQAKVLASIAEEDRANRRVLEDLLSRADSLAID